MENEFPLMSINPYQPLICHNLIEQSGWPSNIFEIHACVLSMTKIAFDRKKPKDTNQLKMDLDLI